jgi:hypothetical protein
MQVNDIDVSNMERRSVMDILANSKHVKMVVRRRRVVGMKLVPISLSPNDGVQFEDGVFIARLKVHSPLRGQMAVGDRVMFVNDIPVAGKSAGNVAELIARLAPNGVVLAVLRTPPSLSPLTPTSSFTNGSMQRVRPRSDDVACQTDASNYFASVDIP